MEGEGDKEMEMVNGGGFYKVFPDSPDNNAEKNIFYGSVSILQFAFLVLGRRQ